MTFPPPMKLVPEAPKVVVSSMPAVDGTVRSSSLLKRIRLCASDVCRPLPLPGLPETQRSHLPQNELAEESDIAAPQE